MTSFGLKGLRNMLLTPIVLFCFLLTVQLFGQLKHYLLHLAWWKHCLCFSSVSSQLKNVQICLKKSLSVSTLTDFRLASGLSCAYMSTSILVETSVLQSVVCSKKISGGRFVTVYRLVVLRLARARTHTHTHTCAEAYLHLGLCRFCLR